MDLTTDYLGLTLKNPLMPGASPLVDNADSVRLLEDSGAAAIVLYSLFEEQIVGEQLAAGQALSQGGNSPEAMSYLPDPDGFRLGPDEYLALIDRIKAAVAVPVIASLNGVTPESWVRYARQIEQVGADALELNIYDLGSAVDLSSEQIEERTVQLVCAVRAETRLPLAVKLLPIYAGLGRFAGRLAEAGADGLVLFNRMYQPTIDLEALEVRPSHPLSHPGELAVRLRWLGVLSPTFPGSLACTGGVHSPEAAIQALACGAHTVQLVSALIRHGADYVGHVLRHICQWLEEQGYETLGELRGSMNLLRCPEPRAYTRANYIQTLAAWD